MSVNEVEGKYNSNINKVLSKKVIFDMNSERTKKRMAQMQKRKEYLNETDSIKIEKSTFSTNNSPNQIEETSPTQLSNLNNNKSNEIINNNQNDQIFLNPFSFEEKSENENSDVEVNISDLDCKVDETIKEDEDLKIITNISSSEYAKSFCHSSSKSFIHLNNNLVARAAAQNDKNTPSYILALCPEILKKSINNKEIISENYAVDNAINEENEIETPNKSNNKHFVIEPIKVNNVNNYNKNKICKNTIYNNNKIKDLKNNNNVNNNNKKNMINKIHKSIKEKNINNNKKSNDKELKIHIQNNNLENNNKISHKKSKSGCFNPNISTTHSIEFKKNPLLNRINSSNSKSKNFVPSKTTSHFHRNSLYEYSKYSFNSVNLPKKPALKINSTREVEYKKKNLMKSIPIPHPKKSINNISKNVKSTTNKKNKNSIISHHCKNKTSYIKPSFLNPIITSLRNNSSSSRLNDIKKNKTKIKIIDMKKEIKYKKHI